MASIKTYPTIKFLPVCSECGHIIRQRVDCREIPTSGICNFIARQEIEPYQCPNCEAVFERIIMPRYVPFDGYH